MKIKLAIFIIILVITSIFLWYSREEFKVMSNNDNSRGELSRGQESVDSSLKIDTDNLIEVSPEDKLKPKSIRNLLDQNDNYKCSWKIEKIEIIEEADVDNEDEEASGGIEEGVIYVADGKFKQEIKVKEQTKENTINLLKNEDQIYQWSSISVQGTKNEVNKAEEIGIVDLDEEHDWFCEAWEEEKDFWNLPENISFIELSSY